MITTLELDCRFVSSCVLADVQMNESTQLELLGNIQVDAGNSPRRRQQAETNFMYITSRAFQSSTIAEVGSGFSSLISGGVCIDPFPRDFIRPRFSRVAIGVSRIQFCV